MTSEIESLFEALVSRDRERQAVAHGRLVELAEKGEAIDTIADRAAVLAEHRDAQVRGSALILLSLTRPNETGRFLKYLKDPEPGVRCDLAQVAIELGEAGTAILLDLLRDEVQEVRFAAASALAGRGRAEGLDVLHEALDRPELRFETLWALAQLGDARSRSPVRRFFKRFFVAPFDRMGAAGVLARLGDAEARRHIVAKVDDRRSIERGLAIDLAGELRLEACADALLKALRDRDDLFRDGAVYALARLADPRAIPALTERLLDQDEERDFRLEVAEALADTGSPEARAALARAADLSPDAELRAAIATATKAGGTPC